jgi:hypothetical protein
MSGQKTELTSVKLSMDLEPRVVEALQQCASTSGRNLAQVVECILRQHMDVCCEEERQPVLVSSLTWDVLIIYARRLKIGTRFNLYDLMIRLHSDMGLASLKISSAWHSAFAQWVRRNNEFTCERTPRGNVYVRNTDREAPLPERVLNPVPFIDRMTNTELLNKLKDAADAKPAGETFTVRDLLEAMEQTKLPKHISGTTIVSFVRWVNATTKFDVFYKESEREGNTNSERAFIRRSTHNSMGEQ